MLAERAEDYRIEYNTVRPRNRSPGTGPGSAPGPGRPTIPFQTTKTTANYLTRDNTPWKIATNADLLGGERVLSSRWA